MDGSWRRPGFPDADRLAELERTEHHLQVEWGRYLLERSTWASPGRIEKQAREQYGLRAPALDDIIRMRP